MSTHCQVTGGTPVIDRDGIDAVGVRLRQLGVKH